jgi:hypothetical protein
MDKENKKFRNVNFNHNRQNDLADWAMGNDMDEIMNSTAKMSMPNDFFTNDVNISTISSIPGSKNNLMCQMI